MSEKEKEEGTKDNPPPSKKSKSKPKFPSPTVYEPGVEQPINLPKGIQLGEE